MTLQKSKFKKQPKILQNHKNDNDKFKTITKVFKHRIHKLFKFNLRSKKPKYKIIFAEAD